VKKCYNGVLAAAILAAALAGCGDVAGPEVVGGVNLDDLFAPPTAAEVSAALEDWAGRDVSAQDVAPVDSAVVSAGSSLRVRVRIVSHTVDGRTHFGAIVVPAGAAAGSLPLLLVAHPGDTGINLDQTLPLLAFGFGSVLSDYVLVVPSFRSEPLVFQGVPYLSAGSPSPWDGDVDDALALLNAAIATTPEADTTRIGTLGLSRGATVALLAAIRDRRIAAVVEFFGPTDFLGAFVRGIVRDALLGQPADLPGVGALDAQFIQPLARGEVTIPEVRSQLIRRSPVYFVDHLPAVELHHGTADSIVPAAEAERLTQVMQAAGRTAPAFQAYLYDGGGHDPLTLPGSLDRTISFLSMWLATALAQVPLR
jgi:dipeptidyl aminopeptidase/acylaminoacyl peptidase